MASKKNRSKKNLTSANPRSYSDLYKDDRSTVAPSAEVSASKPASVRSPEVSKKPDSVDWKQDYGYVMKDLRQLLIVSVVLFALVIGVGLFL